MSCVGKTPYGHANDKWKKGKLNEIDVVSAFKLWVCVHMCTRISKPENPNVSVYVLFWIV